MSDEPRVAANCRVSACCNDHVHVELLDEDDEVFAELVCEDIDEALSLVAAIQSQIDEIRSPVPEVMQ